MTIICIKDGVIAADSGCFVNDFAIGTKEKIKRLPDGSLVAFSGLFTDCLMAEEWLSEGADRLHPRPDFDGKDDDAIAGLWLRRDGIWRIEGQGMPYLVDEPFAAEGAHCDFALGAMAHGAGAALAVDLCVQYGVWARGPVVARRLEE